MDKEAAEEGDVDTLGDEELEECHVEESSTAAESGVLSDTEDTRGNITEATEATDDASPRRSNRKRRVTQRDTDSSASDNRRYPKRKQRRVDPGVEEQKAISPRTIFTRAEVWIQPHTFEQFRHKNGADFNRVKNNTSLVIIDPVYKGTVANELNEAKYSFRAAS